MRTESADPHHLLDVTLDELSAWCEQQGMPAYRARQIMEWVYRKNARDFGVMTNLPRGLREELSRVWSIRVGRVSRRQDSGDGTVKLLLAWPDGAASECVLIPDGRRTTACISSQVGCPVGCRFCASGLNGLQRQLTAGQIVEQVLAVRDLLEAPVPEPGADNRPVPADRPGRIPSMNSIKHLRDLNDPDRLSPPPFPAGDRGSGDEEEISGRHQREYRDSSASKSLQEELPARGPAAGPPAGPSNIVFMGLGEPLANYRAVLRAIRIINAPWGPGIGARSITVSTVGLPGQIRRLAEEKLQINLAISLHAPTDKLRRELIPWAKRVSIADLVEAGRYYFDRTGREVTLEYILLGGVNDQPEHAHELVRICRKMRCNVNLIRYNPVPGLPFTRPTSFAAHRFVQRLRERGVNAHIRKSRGLDIEAACGQLRRAAALQTHPSGEG